VTEGTRIVLAGVAIGVAIAFVCTRFLGALLYEVKAVDPIVFALMSTLMIGVGMLASDVPARRASSVDSLVSLSSDWVGAAR